MSAETTLPTGIDSAAWFVPTAALGAGLAVVVFSLKHQPDTFLLGFVLDIGTDFAVAPAADLLVVACPMVDAISDMPDITQDDGTSLAFHGDIDKSATDFVLHIAQDTRMFGLHPRPGTEQAVMPSGAFCGTTEGVRERGESFVMALLLMPSCPTGDERGFCCVAYHGGMDLPQIDTDDVGAWCSLGLSSVFDDHMPSITTRFLVVD